MEGGTSLFQSACQCETPSRLFLLHRGYSVHSLNFRISEPRAVTPSLHCRESAAVFPLAGARKDPVCIQYFSHQQAALSSLLYSLLGTGASVCLILESRERVFANAPGLGHTLKLLLVLSSSGWSLPMHWSTCVSSRPDGCTSHPLRIVLQPAMCGT